MGAPQIRSLQDDAWQEQNKPLGIWKFLDLCGEHLGVRVEELAVGDVSSVHHYHTLEEEHVIALEGQATLVFGDQEYPFVAGDHVWFRAGDEIAHHFVNSGTSAFRCLVIGERKRGDVCVYPEHGVANIKAMNSGWKQFDIAQRSRLLQAELRAERSDLNQDPDNP
ncbi:MAG: cupin domain-containing protein [Pseudomonadota bacterium]